VPEFWSNLGSTIWYAILIVVFVTYIMALFAIISDLFRDHKRLITVEGVVVA
jgi:hypothetical protein